MVSAATTFVMREPLRHHKRPQLALGVKIGYLYSMKPRLVNVRLDADYARKARLLRDRGVVLSDLVREAIDARYEALAQGDEPRNAKELIARIFERHPDEAHAEPRDYDVHSGAEARAAIRRRLSGG
jgi:hypothetical protein